MKKIILIAAVVIIVSCLGFVALPHKAIAAEWTKADVLLEATYLSLHVIDWRQTRYIAKNPDKYHETNFLLGDHPSSQCVDAYFLLTGLGHLGIAHFLSGKHRSIWQAIWIGIEFGYVKNNVSLGIRIDW